MIDPQAMMSEIEGLKERLAAALAQSAAHQAEAEGLMEALKQYAVHWTHCSVHADKLNPDPACNCGLDRIWNAPPAAFSGEREARIWEEAARLIYVDDMTVRNAFHALMDKAAALRAGSGKP